MTKEAKDCGLNVGSTGLLGKPLKEENNIEKLREIAERLWQLLDDIDTASDMFKPHDEDSFKAFYKFSMRKCEERGQHMNSDGYDLFMPNATNQRPDGRKE